MDIANVGDFYDWLQNPFTDAVYGDTIGCVIAAAGFTTPVACDPPPHTPADHSGAQTETRWDLRRQVHAARSCSTVQFQLPARSPKAASDPDPCAQLRLTQCVPHTSVCCRSRLGSRGGTCCGVLRASGEPMVAGGVFGNTTCFDTIENGVIDKGPMKVGDLTCVPPPPPCLPPLLACGVAS